MHTMNDTALEIAPAEMDLDLGIEELDEMIDPDFWDGFVVGVTMGGAAAAGAIAIAT